MTWPASPTAGGCSTTSSRSSCGRSPGLTYPLVNPSYTPDAAVNAITDGLTSASTSYLSQFPYLGTPQSGFATTPLAA